MIALIVQSPLAFLLDTLTGSVLNMKRYVAWNKWRESQELSNTEEVQSSSELLLWRKKSSSPFTARYFSTNENALGHPRSPNEDIPSPNENENQQLFNTSSPSTNLTTDNSAELRIKANNKPETDSHLSQKSVTITRRTSKPSRHETIQRATSQTRQRQRDRYRNYRNQLKEHQLYSLIISSNGVECYGTNCEPSVFNASNRCQITSSEKDTDALKKSPLMIDHDIKENISYISLTNLSNIIDHEPNVSRRDSYSRSTSSILMHKPSLLLADIFNKMTHTQRAKSIAQLVQLHENLTKSNTTNDRLQRTTSLPNFNNKPTKLQSVTSSTSPTEQNHTVTSSDKRTTDLNTENTPVHISEPPKELTISSPIKLISLPKFNPLFERKSSQENTPAEHTDAPLAASSAMSSRVVHSSVAKPSPISIKLSTTTTDIEKAKINGSNHILDAHLNEQSSTSKLKPFKTSKIERIKTGLKTTTPSSNSITSSKSVEKHQSDNETNLENDNDLFSKPSVKQNIQEIHSRKDINQPVQTSSLSNKTTDSDSQSKVLPPSMNIKEKEMPLSSPHFQSSNDENEIENSLNDVTDHLSQQDMTISNTNLDKSFDLPLRESNKTKQTLPLLKTIDEVSRYSKSSHSHLKNSTLFITSPAISTSKKTLSKTLTKSELSSLSPADDGNKSLITRTATVSTNLTITNEDDDNDEQSKLIHEQLKRSSLGLARDSLELLRNATPHHASNDEQLISHTNIDSTPQKRKSMLKSRLDSSDNLLTPELISYIAVDEVKGDKRLLEKQMRRRSLTVGGGTIISCTSPKPKRDSLVLLQERFSESTTPRSGYYHLSSSDSRHVEFIREPGDTITPVLHIGRGIKSKQPSSKLMSPSSSNDHFHQTFESSERTKREISVTGSQQEFGTETHERRSSLDSVSRYRTPQTQLTSTTTSFINTDDIDEEKICFNKSDYDEMVHLILTPLSNKKRKDSIKSTRESNIELCISNRLTTLQNLILLILLIFFYIFIFIKSQYWQDHN